jgi:hypothetical protein
MGRKVVKGEALLTCKSEVQVERIPFRRPRILKFAG